MKFIRLLWLIVVGIIMLTFILAIELGWFVFIWWQTRDIKKTVSIWWAYLCRSLAINKDFVENGL